MPSKRCFKRPPPEKFSLHRTRRCQRRSTRLVPLPLFSRVARLRLRASLLSALRPGHDAPFNHASRARDARRARRARQACSPRALAPRARPARAPRALVRVRPPRPPARAAGPCTLPARAPSPGSLRAGLAARCAPCWRGCCLPWRAATAGEKKRQQRTAQTQRNTRARRAAQAPAAACKGAVQLVGRSRALRR
jgi:hypothetical protein